MDIRSRRSRSVPAVVEFDNRKRANALNLTRFSRHKADWHGKGTNHAPRIGRGAKHIGSFAKPEAQNGPPVTPSDPLFPEVVQPEAMIELTGGPLLGSWVQIAKTNTGN